MKKGGGSGMHSPARAWQTIRNFDPNIIKQKFT